MDITPPDLDAKTIETYVTAIDAITEAELPILVGGGLAFQYHTGYPRTFNDLDIFCKAGDYPKILKVLDKKGFTTKVQDEKWIAKAFKDAAQLDLLFSTPNSVQIVEDSWFSNGQKGTLFGREVLFLGAEELLWSKIYVQDANKYDGPDVHHLILKTGDSIDWKNLLSRMEADWEVLLASVITFRFVFPSKRGIVPDWLMQELTERLRLQLDMPTPVDDICRGPLLSRTNYTGAIEMEGFIV